MAITKSKKPAIPCDVCGNRATKLVIVKPGQTGAYDARLCAGDLVTYEDAFGAENVVSKTLK